MTHETGMEPEPQRNLTIIMIVAAIVILSLCCCALAVVLWFTGDSILEALELAARFHSLVS